MTEIFEPKRHESISAEWDETKAREYITALFNATEQSFETSGLWPPHPDDGEPQAGRDFKPYYHGFAGVCWAQKELEQLGYGSVRNSYQETLAELREEALQEMKANVSFPNKEEYLKGLLIAELGFVVAQIKLEPESATLKAEALSLIEGNLENGVLELLWGSPGSMLVLASLIRSGTVSDANAQLLIKGASYLKEQLVISPLTQARLWNQHLYGQHSNILGAAHGFGGNSLALIKSFPFLNDEARKEWTEQICTTAKLTCKIKAGFANWCQSVDQFREGRTTYLVQFCHGAPGMVICLTSLMGHEPEFDDVLLKAGELTWHAGPLKKGSGFCHGTSGNGWAFLKLFAATQDEKWLDRAKRFAAVAIYQSELAKAEFGDYRYSLWTGDTGVALYLHAILKGDFEVPGLERF